MRPRAVLACVLLALPPCLARTLDARDDHKDGDQVPAPLSVTPAQNWDGIDGSWNSMWLRIGTPEQYVRAFVSTASQQTWAVYVQACMPNVTNADNQTVEELDRTCYEDRGRTFNISGSTTWNELGFYQLWLEKNLGLLGNGRYGYDTVGLGNTAQEGPTLKNTTVGTLITENFYLGHFGINPKPTNFSAFSDPSPSYLTYLFEGKQIPSLSWGYTAGAQYHEAIVLGSLTLGGYDASRFVPNNLSFGFAPDNERDIVVGVVGIHANSATKSNVSLLNRDQFTMYIDSTVAELYLPVEVCEAFEQAFGLTYDNATGLYLVDALLHETLKADNPTITFTLGQKFSTNSTIDISLPYAALDLVARPPYSNLTNQTNYFPIRRAEKESQFVLGRTFLQEAYLIVDWERQNFSVSQCSWAFGKDADVVTIVSPSYTAKQHFSTGAIIGIAIGGGFTLAMAAFAIAWWFRRRRQRAKMAAVKAKYALEGSSTKEPHSDKSEEPPTSPVKEEEGTNVFPKAELPAESASKPEMSTDAKEGDVPSPAVETDNTERQIFEMPGDIPARQEADGRQLSEKESMMVREAIYNGVDPRGPPSASPTSEEPPRRLAPVSPSEVTIVNRRPPGALPTPRTPRTPRDGASLEASDTFFQPPPRAPRDGRFLEAEDALLSPISPLDGPGDTSRRRFSYEE